jgi:hypothetical protein
MWAMAGQESGWDYYARNGASGAFGKYQIMPFNWPAWAELYLGSRHADQTPYNQEVVAYGKLRDLHGWLGTWRRVAYWWLTGSSERNERRWSDYARGYVENIMALRSRAPARLEPWPRPDRSAPGRGEWRRAVGGQSLRLVAAGRRWRVDGRLRDGEIVVIRAARRAEGGVRWLRVVTRDGRMGWVRQARTVPTGAPERAAQWRDVRDQGERARGDRDQVRPRPR